MASLVFSSHQSSAAQIGIPNFSAHQRSFTLVPSTQASWLHTSQAHSTLGSQDHRGEDAQTQAPSRISVSSVATDAQSSAMPSSVYFQYPLPLGHVPPPRWSHSTCVVGNLLVVYGGIGNSLLDDLQLLDCSTMSWRTVTTNAPSSKDRPEKVMGHACAAVGNRMWLFGGQQGRKLLAKLYSCDIGDACNWQRHNNDTLPTPRAGHSMVAVGSNVFLFGGQGKKLYNDMYLLNSDTGVFQQLPERGRVPSPRRGHSLVYDGHDTLILFGGTGATGIDNHLAAYSVSRCEWFALATTGSPPSPRTQHSAVMLSSSCMLIFGGCNSQGTFHNDAYILDLQSLAWSKPQLLNTAPAPRYHHSCNVVNGKCVVYGGINSKQTFEGVVVIETKFLNDISHIAEELSAMSAGVSTDRTARLPPEVVVVANREPSSSTTGPSLDLDAMKLQLTDLLMKRSIEERHVQAALKAEATETQLTMERTRNEALQKELLQLRLLVSETEEEKQLWEGRAREAAFKLQKESAAVFDLQQEVRELQEKLAVSNTQLEEARAIQQGLVKELGVLSSRYSKMQHFCESARHSSSTQRAVSNTRASTDATNNSDSQSPSGSDATLPEPQFVLPPEDLAASEIVCPPASQRSAPSFSDTSGPPSASACEQLLQLLSKSEQQRASLLEEATVLQRRCEQLQQDKLENERVLDRLEAKSTALDALSVEQLSDLESRLEAAARKVRETVMHRAIAEVQKKASSEQLQCSVCLEHPKSVVFNCGHQCCGACGAKMTACPFCRVAITTKIKLFDV